MHALVLTSMLVVSAADGVTTLDFRPKALESQVRGAVPSGLDAGVFSGLTLEQVLNSPPDAKRTQFLSTGCGGSTDAVACVKERSANLKSMDIVEFMPRSTSTVSQTAIAGVSWEAAVLQGLSEFLADRAQSEVGAWFFEAFASDLCGTDEHPSPSRPFFADTCALLDVPTVRDAPGALFTTAMRSDLENLPGRVLFVLVDGEVVARPNEAALTEDEVKSITAARRLVTEAVAEFFRRVRAGGKPLEYLAAFGRGDASKPETLLGAEAVLCKARTKGVVVGCSLGVIGIVASKSGDVSSAGRDPSERVGAALALADAARDALRQLLGTQSAIDSTKFAALLDSFFEFADLLKSWSARPSASDREALARAAELLEGLRSIFVSTAELVITDPTQLSKVKTVGSVLSMASSVFRGDVAGALNTLLLIDGAQKVLPENLRRTASLAVELAAARDAASVKTLLEAQATPVGGWRMKRRGFTVSVVGLVGAGAGGELALGPTPRSVGASAGLLAQVGVDFTGPIGKDFTFGFALTALDVGQLTWSRIDSVVTGADGAQTIPELGFAQVFSPGGYFMLGLGRSPFVLSAGVSLAPQLRRYTLGGVNTPESVLRFNLGLSVDVTILPIVGGH